MVNELEKEARENEIAHQASVGMDSKISSSSSTATMLRAFIKVALPTTVSLLVLTGSQTVIMSCVGHRLGFVKLAQFSVGLSVFNIVGASTGLCWSGNVDTLATQAMGRDPHQRHNELYFLLLQSTLFFVVLLIPTTLLFHTMDPTLSMIYGENLASGASEFLRSSSLYLFLIWEGNVLARLLASQSLAQLSFYANIAGLAGNVFLGTYFIHAGATLSQTIEVLTVGQSIIFTSLLLATVFHPKALIFPRRIIIGGNQSIETVAGEKIPQELLTGKTGTLSFLFAPEFLKKLRNWQEWHRFLILGLWSCVSGVAAWWAFEALSVVVAQLGEVNIAGFTIIINLMCMFFAFCEGIAVGASTCIGNALGANQPELARQYTELAIRIAIATGLCTSTILFFGGPYLYQLYTSDKEVLDLISPMSGVHAWWHFTDIFQVLLSHGLYRAAGQQGSSLKFLLPALWLVGLPCGYFLGVKGAIFNQRGLPATILGQSIGVVVMVGLLLWNAVKHWNYVTLAKIAAAASSGSEKQKKNFNHDDENDHCENKKEKTILEEADPKEEGELPLEEVMHKEDERIYDESEL